MLILPRTGDRVLGKNGDDGLGSLTSDEPIRGAAFVPSGRVSCEYSIATNAHTTLITPNAKSDQTNSRAKYWNESQSRMNLMALYSCSAARISRKIDDIAMNR